MQLNCREQSILKEILTKVEALLTLSLPRDLSLTGKIVWRRQSKIYKSLLGVKGLREIVF